jgi:hypothetical protein
MSKRPTELFEMLRTWAAAQGASPRLDASDCVMLLLLAELQLLGFRWAIATSTAPASTDSFRTQLPSDWRPVSKETGSSERFYSVKVKHDQSQFHFVVKGLLMSDKLIVHGLAEEVSFH